MTKQLTKEQKTEQIITNLNLLISEIIKKINWYDHLLSLEENEKQIDESFKENKNSQLFAWKEEQQKKFENEKSLNRLLKTNTEEQKNALVNWLAEENKAQTKKEEQIDWIDYNKATETTNELKKELKQITSLFESMYEKQENEDLEKQIFLATRLIDFL